MGRAPKFFKYFNKELYWFYLKYKSDIKYCTVAIKLNVKEENKNWSDTNKLKYVLDPGGSLNIFS